jgi:hypothetical protein
MRTGRKTCHTGLRLLAVLSLSSLIALAGCSPSRPRQTKPAASVAPTPTVTPLGWVRVSHGKAQIAVPAAWSTITTDCPYGRWPGVIIQRDVAAFTGCVAETGSSIPNTVRIAPISPPVLEPSGHHSVINGIDVDWGRPLGTQIGYQVPSLGVQIDSSGPLARRVLHTLTTS